jgi:hypothetical protein
MRRKKQSPDPNCEGSWALESTFEEPKKRGSFLERVFLNAFFPWTKKEERLVIECNTSVAMISTAHHFIWKIVQMRSLVFLIEKNIV